MELALWMLLWGRMELGLLVEQDGCFSPAEVAAAVEAPAPSAPEACWTIEDIEEHFGVELHPSAADAVLRVTKGAERLPVVRARLRATTWARLGHRADPEAVEAVRGRVDARPSLTLRGTVDTARNVGTQGASLRTALGPGTLRVDATDTTDQGLTRLRSGWSWSGPTSQGALGDVAIQSNHLSSYRQGRGAQVYVGPRGRRGAAFTRDLEGDRLSADHEVEIYVGGRLVDYLPAGDDRWRFEDVPGPSTVEIVQHGPTGEETRETIELGGRGLLPPGRWSYTGAAVQTDRHTLGDHGPSGDTAEQGQLAHSSRLAYGIADWLTVGVSRRDLPGGYHLTGVEGRAHLFGADLGGEVVEDGHGSLAGLAGAHLGPLSLEHEQRSEEFQADRHQGRQMHTEARLRFPVAPGASVGLQAERETTWRGTERRQGSLDLWLYRGRFSGQLELDQTWTNTAGSTPPRARLAGRWRDETWTVTGSHSLSLLGTLGTSAASARHRLYKDVDLVASGTYGHETETWSLRPGVQLADADGWRLGIQGSVDQEGETGLVLSFSTSLAFDDQWQPRVDPKAARAFVAVRVFQDTDGDGRWSQGDLGVPGVPVRSVGKTDADGYAKAWLTPGREIIVDLGVDELDDPRHYGTGPKAFTVRPGGWTQVDYPVRFVPL